MLRVYVFYFQLHLVTSSLLDFIENQWVKIATLYLFFCIQTNYSNICSMTKTSCVFKLNIICLLNFKSLNSFSLEMKTFFLQNMKLYTVIHTKPSIHSIILRDCVHFWRRWFRVVLSSWWLGPCSHCATSCTSSRYSCRERYFWCICGHCSEANDCLVQTTDRQCHRHSCRSSARSPAPALAWCAFVSFSVAELHRCQTPSLRILQNHREREKKMKKERNKY